MKECSEFDHAAISWNDGYLIFFKWVSHVIEKRKHMKTIRVVTPTNKLSPKYVAHHMIKAPSPNFQTYQQESITANINTKRYFGGNTFVSSSSLD